jgi:hypothetical protein
MATTTIQLDLTKYGIQGIGPVTIGGIEAGEVEGKPVSDWPRNEAEQQQLIDALKKVTAYQKAAGNVSGNVMADLEAYEKKIQERQAKIKDPIGYYMRQQQEKAKTGPGLIEGMGELLDLPPGGDPFEPGKLLQGILNFGATKLTSKDPKATLGDVAVIASDVVGASLLSRGVAGKRVMDNALISNAVKNSPAKSATALTAMNIFARGAANETYDMLNQITRYLSDIPNLTEAMEKDETLRNLYDMRNELLWSGGAVGLSQMWPFIKRGFAPLVGVTKGGIDMMKKGVQYGVPMNVFSVTESNIVKGAGKVIGLFPFVATKARQAQNAQQVAMAQSINRTLNNYSPISLLNDAGMLADKNFREGVAKFASTKETLYKSALDIGDEIGDKFIPTAQIKEEAFKLSKRLGLDQRKIMLDLPGDYGAQAIDFEELLATIPTLKTQGAFEKILPALQFIKGDYMNARQFDMLQTSLNDILQHAGEAGAAGSAISHRVEPFTQAMVTAINDFKGFADLNDPAKNALKDAFANRYTMANKFFTDNIDSLKDRTAQVLALADLNVAKPGAVGQPGWLKADQLAEILLDSKSMSSPMAIKEMRLALGNADVMINGVKTNVNVFDAVARSVLDDKMRVATRYISGKVKLTSGGQTWGERITRWIPGTEGFGAHRQQATKWGTTGTAQFNVPILDVEQMKTIFGMGESGKNRVAGMKEILGEKVYKEMENVLDLAGQVQQTSFGDVSDFVKRRGFLGGANAITNLITGGMLASNPFGNLGLMLMARYGMTTLADPKFLKNITTVMNPTISDLAKRQALMTLGRMRWDDVRGDENLPPEVRDNFDSGNPIDVMKYLIFSENQSAFPGNEQMIIKTDDAGYATGLDIVKADSKPTFSQDGQETGQKIMVDEVQEQAKAPRQPATKGPFKTLEKDPFLNVDFEEMTQTVPTGGATQPLSPDQRVALAGGNLDEALALGSQRRI